MGSEVTTPGAAPGRLSPRPGRDTGCLRPVRGVSVKTSAPCYCPCWPSKPLARSLGARPPGRVLATGAPVPQGAGADAASLMARGPSALIARATPGRPTILSRAPPPPPPPGIDRKPELAHAARRARCWPSTPRVRVRWRRPELGPRRVYLLRPRTIARRSAAIPTMASLPSTIPGAGEGSDLRAAAGRELPARANPGAASLRNGLDWRVIREAWAATSRRPMPLARGSLGARRRLTRREASTAIVGDRAGSRLTSPKADFSVNHRMGSGGGS